MTVLILDWLLFKLFNDISDDVLDGGVDGKGDEVNLTFEYCDDFFNEDK